LGKGTRAREGIAQEEEEEEEEEERRRGRRKDSISGRRKNYFNIPVCMY
jgi:hypothetical protein